MPDTRAATCRLTNVRPKVAGQDPTSAASESLMTRQDLRSEIASLEARLYRALRWQTVITVVLLGMLLWLG